MFKRGDVVWCTESGIYSITTYHVPCIVVGISEDGFLEVELLKKSGHIYPFYVYSEYFEKISVSVEL